MAGYRGEFKNNYATLSQKLGVRVSVIKDEFQKAKRRKKEIEKERAYDPIERQQRESIREAGARIEINGEPAADLFAHVGMALPVQGEDGEDLDAEAEKEAAE